MESWSSTDSAHSPADLWPLKRSGTFARFLCICLRSHIRTTISPRWARYPNWIMRSEVTRLDSLSTVLKMRTLEENRTVVREVICYSLRSVMEICRYSPHPTTNALIDCIYHNQAPCCALLSPITPPLVYATAIHLRHISTLYDVFGRFSPVLAYFALHLFRTG